MDDRIKPLKYREVKIIDILLSKIPCANSEIEVDIGGWVCTITSIIFLPYVIGVQVLVVAITEIYWLRIIMALLGCVIIFKPMGYIAYLIGIKAEHFC